jgi:hypothetical protein
MKLIDKVSVTSTRWVIEDETGVYEVIRGEDWDDDIMVVWVVIDDMGDELDECELRDKLIELVKEDLNS